MLAGKGEYEVHMSKAVFGPQIIAIPLMGLRHGQHPPVSANSAVNKRSAGIRLSK
jgi:hypothetical protein